MSEELSRRSFVSGAVAAGALGSLASVALADEAAPAGEGLRYVPSEPESWDYETEFLVLGVGIGGGCAMIEAHDLGLDVMGIEKAPDLSNFSACTWSGGALCGFGSEIQLASQGDADSIDLWMKDILKAGDECGDPDIIQTWGEHSGLTIDWLQQRVGVEILPELRLSTEHTVRRSHNAVPYNGGYGWCRAIENTINALGLPVLLETAATKIHRNAEGRVIGAQAMDLNTGDVINVKATKGVLLSTNHAGSNMKAWAYYSPISRYMMEHSELCGSPYPLQILGDGPRMLDEIDGYQYPLQSLYGGDCVKVSERGAGLSCFCHRWGNDASIWLNKQGKRWGKETFYEYYTERTWRDNDPKCYYVLVDDEFVKSDVGQENLQMIIDTAEKTGYTESYFCADTVEEVCEHFGIDGEQAAKTLADWNALVESGGVDEEFGRGIEEGTSMGRPINKPPYWIFAPGLSFGTAKAGGRITPKAEALDTQRNIIPGLYLCGEMASYQAMGSAHQHITGGCNSNSANFARIAARTAAGVTDEEADAIDRENMAKGPEAEPEYPQEWDRSANFLRSIELAESGKYDPVTWDYPEEAVY